MHVDELWAQFNLKRTPAHPADLHAAANEEVKRAAIAFDLIPWDRAHPEDLALVTDHALRIATTLDEIEPQDVPAREEEAIRRLAAVHAAGIRRAHQAATTEGSGWGELVWRLELTREFLRSQLTEDELFDSDLVMPWPEMDLLETTVRVALDGGAGVTL